MPGDEREEMQTERQERGEGVRERALLVGVSWDDVDRSVADESLRELHSLAETAGAEVVGEIAQTRARPDPATLIGKGKLEELSSLVAGEEADLVVFDAELTPSQQRNLENELSVKILDRTALILDIFALHARSKEGKAQVEMAQLRYRLTRLTGRGTELSRMGGVAGAKGPIGARGPGEMKLEVDRRRINTRIKTLDRELKNLSRVRKVKRKRRERRSVPTFALVGYTNAGKSSLLNSLTGAGVLVEDQLFSTLDPVTRRIILPGNQPAVITDTVGFINHLPHQLVEAFKSTLEEVGEADVLLHVIDASSPNVQARIDAVNEVLDEIGAVDMKCIYVLNKDDLLDDASRMERGKAVPSGLFISTLTGGGLQALLERMSASLSTSRTVRLLIPHGRGEVLASLYRRGEVLSMVQEDGEDGFRVIACLPEGMLRDLGDFLLDDGAVPGHQRSDGEG